MRATKLKLLLVLPIVALALGFLALPHSAKAATYTVTTTDDAGAGSLRQAITDANANGGADQIDFAIAGSGPHTITLTSGGLTITDQVKLNGLSQSGSVCNGTSSTLKVVIEGAGVGVGGAGANGTEINGLVFGVGTAVGISSNSNTIRCNFFGTTADGSQGVGDINSQYLIIYNDSAVIGGDSSSDMNLFGRYRFIISGNNNHVIKNNLIGTDITGMNSLGSILSFNGAVYNNVTISHNVLSRINAYYATFNNFTLSANKIGTNVSGTAAIFGDIGTLLSTRTEFNNSTIGGATEADGNVISGAVIVSTNEWGHAIVIGGANNTIQNNKIGVNADATAIIGNGYEGISIECGNNCSNTQVLDNIIGGSSDGIRVTDGSGSTNNNRVTIQRNYIGTNKAKNIDLGNRVAGIRIDGSMGNVLVGGPNPADKNVIANNSVGIYSVAATHNTFLGNEIYNNEQLGIAFGYYNANYPTQNDTNDVDTGPNDLLNYPIITQATASSGNTNIGYSLDVPAGDYRIEFYSNTAADPTGYGEGETFIGYDEITSTGTGNQNFSTTITGTGYTHLAATATLKDTGAPSGFGPTSEFGKFEPRTDLAVASDDGTTSAVYGESHQYTFTVTNNGPGDVDHFTFQGANNVLYPYTYSVDSDNTTATSPGSFDGDTWSGLLKSGETLTLILSGDVLVFGNLETSQVCIDPSIRLGGQTIIDTDESNNCGTDDDTLVPTPVADIEITKTLDAPGTIKNGESATYTIGLTNHGPDTAVGGTYIYDVLPHGVEYSAVIGDNVGCEDPHEDWPFSGTGHYIFCGFGFDSIANGQTVSFKIVVNIESIDETQPTLNKALVFYELDPEAQALGQAFGAGQDPFTTLSNNSIVIHTYDPNAQADDNDRISKEIEDAAPNSGDANGDGTPDSQQANVASFVDPVTGQYATLEVGSECSITAASTAAESANTTPDSNYNYPAGLMNFSLSCGTPGITTTVTQYYYSVATQGFVLRKYNPNSNTYTNLDSANIIGVSVGGQSATKASYQITDGSNLDTDGATDGNITDPIGLAVGESLLAKTGINIHKNIFVIFSIALVSAGIAGLVIAGYQGLYANKRNSRI